MNNKLEIDLQLLRECDNWSLLMWEIEQLCIKLNNQTKLGKRVFGIVKMLVYEVEIEEIKNYYADNGLKVNAELEVVFNKNIREEDE